MKPHDQILLFQQVPGLHGRLSIWHSVPLKPAGHEQIYPWEVLLLLIQVPPFSQGLNMSYGADEILQSRPIWYWPGQDRGAKNNGGDSATNEISYK